MESPATLAAHCADAGIPLIHVSTDYVFDGAKGAPYNVSLHRGEYLQLTQSVGLSGSTVTRAR